MAPGFAEFPSLRALVGAAAPLLLAAFLIAPDVVPRHSPLASRTSHSKAPLRAPTGSHPSASPAFQEGDDLRAFVERARLRLDDPQTMYYVSQALEECHAWGTMPDDDDSYPAVSVVSHMDLLQWKRAWASSALAAPCRGFDGRTIDSREIFVLVQEAARQGEPHATARMLAFRDIA